MGRPHGSVDKTRDYFRAVAKMRALVANGASEREASRIIGEELRIPASTLRKHLTAKGKLASGPRFNVHQMLSKSFCVQTEIVTKEQAEEAARRCYEKERLKREEERPPTKAEQQLEMLRRLDLLPDHPPPRPKKRRG